MSDRFAGSVTEHEDKLINVILNRLQIDLRNKRRWAKVWKWAAKNWRDSAIGREYNKNEARAWARRMKRERDEARLMLEVALRHNRALEFENAKLNAELQKVKAANETMLLYGRSHPINEFTTLQHDNARLRELIKSVEWHDENHCLFCGVPHYDNQTGDKFTHLSTCPAFNPDGTVK